MEPVQIGRGDSRAFLDRQRPQEPAAMEPVQIGRGDERGDP